VIGQKVITTYIKPASQQVYTTIQMAAIYYKHFSETISKHW